MKTELYQALWMLLFTFVTALLAILATAAKNYLRTKLRTDQQRAILDRAWEFVSREVAAANQTAVPVIRAATTDGKITPDEAAKLRALVIVKVKESLGKAGLELLNQATGERDVTAYLESLAESAVNEQKAK
jgi:hypothetical protein